MLPRHKKSATSTCAAFAIFLLLSLVWTFFPHAPIPDPVLLMAVDPEYCNATETIW
jgi:hypothetical protein